MSENVMSTGVMVPISRKLTRAERQEWGELLWEQGSNVRFNYEGTLVYTQERGDEYGIHFGDAQNFGPFWTQDFQILEQFGLSIQPTKARSYLCYWYNGVDSDMDMMTLENFLKRTKQND